MRWIIRRFGNPTWQTEIVPHLHHMGFRVTRIIEQEQPEVPASCDFRATVASAFAAVCSGAL